MVIPFKEELLQFIWKHRLLSPGRLLTSSGQEVTIVRPGEQNHDSGPDFFNAMVRINGIALAGSIEIHVRTSDWLKHGHYGDKNYDNIILHVVYEHDTILQQNVLHNVEVLEVKDHLPESTISRYAMLTQSNTGIACQRQLEHVEDFTFLSWLQRMSIERLEKQMHAIGSLFTSLGSSYTHTFYTLLFRNFGFKVNAEPFELLAKSLPMAIVMKHANSRLQTEALLLGMAGMLDGQFEAPYVNQLQNEFEFLNGKYRMVPLPRHLFKYSKMRPANFPNVRLVQLATLIHTFPGIFSNPVAYMDISTLKASLAVAPAGYWSRRYTMDGPPGEQVLALGMQSIENLVINSFAPFMFFYGRKNGHPEMEAGAIELLEGCGAENNLKTRLFLRKKKIVVNAANSQGLIQLYDRYCRTRRCLDCGIGSSLISKG